MQNAVNLVMAYLMKIVAVAHATIDLIDRSVDIAFRREVEDRVYAIFYKCFVYQRRIADIAVYKGEGFSGNAVEGGFVSRIGQLVVDNDLIAL